MKIRFALISFLSAIILTGCAPISAAYKIEPAPAVSEGTTKVVVPLFVDLRSEEEKSGAGAGLFNRSTKDAIYSEKVNEAVTRALIDELRARGINAVERGDADYRVTGEIRHYRAMIVPPRTAFIPYVSYVTWLWTKDRISVGVEMDVKLEGPTGEMLKETYKLSSNTEEWVGLAGLSSSARRLDSEGLVKVLRAGLKSILTKTADDISSKLKN